MKWCHLILFGKKLFLFDNSVLWNCSGIQLQHRADTSDTCNNDDANVFLPKFEPPAGCDESCWGYQPCNVGFTHPSYEGWNHTGQLPSCSRTSPTDPLHNGEGCCHTTAYMAVKDQVKVPKVQPGEYVVRWRWDCEQSPQIWSGCGDVTIE